MSSEEALSPTPPLFPLGRVAPIRALKDMNPRFVSVEKTKRVQSVINEELFLIMGVDGKPGENPQVKRYMDLMSAHCDIGEGLNITALRVGMLFLYHTARLRGDALGTEIPKVSKDQLTSYFSSKSMAIEDNQLIQYGNDPWINTITQFQSTEHGVMNALNANGRSANPTYASFELGCTLMWDFLKTAPTFQPIET